MCRYVYRIKTEDELLKEFGREWRKAARFNPNGEMDYLLGKYMKISTEHMDEDMNVVSIFTIRKAKQRRPNGVDVWAIYPKMLVREVAREKKVERIIKKAQSGYAI